MSWGPASGARVLACATLAILASCTRASVPIDDGEPDATASAMMSSPFMVSPIYVVPADKQERPDAPDAILQGVRAARAFYATALRRGDGTTQTFQVDSAGVRTVRSAHPAAFFSRARHDTTEGDTFIANVREEATSLTADIDDAYHTRFVFVDAEPPCGMVQTASYPRLSIFDGKRIRGLAGDDPPNTCPGSGPAWTSSCFFAGTIAHEGGHAFGVPHPPFCEHPACDAGHACSTPPLCFELLMFLGRDLRDRKVVFLDEEKDRLRASPFLLPLRDADIGPMRCERRRDAR